MSGAEKLDMTGDVSEAIAFIVEIDKMKSIRRRSLTYDGSHYEDDAEHSWHLSVMALALERYAARPVNIERVLKMTLIHDLVEVYAGDTFAFDAAATVGQKEREETAADKIFAMIPEGAELRALWEEFDEGKTADASLRRRSIRLQPLLANHLNEGHTWRMGNVDAAAGVPQGRTDPRSDSCALGHRLRDGGGRCRKGIYPPVKIYVFDLLSSASERSRVFDSGKIGVGNV